jgi:hypothetical protein
VRQRFARVTLGALRHRRGCCYRRHLATELVLVTLLLGHTASGEEPAPPRVFTPTEDGTYGRIEGDLGVVVGAGGVLAPRGPRGSVELRLRYLDTAGIFVTEEDAPLFGSPSDPRRVFATGIEVRPLFLARWLTGREFLSARPDLLVDSFGLELGAFFEQPQGAAFASRPGVQAGLGIELPILPRASGPFIGLHGGVRWSDSALEGASISGPNDRALFLSITVAWHQIFGAHVVDFRDGAPR